MLVIAGTPPCPTAAHLGLHPCSPESALGSKAVGWGTVSPFLSVPPPPGKPQGSCPLGEAFCWSPR